MTAEALPLKQHQLENVEWIRKVRKGLLADQPGLGKSRSAIEAVDGSNALIIAPKMIVNTKVWQDEINRWSAHPDKYEVVPYSMLNDRVKGKGSGSKPVKKLREEINKRFDAVIIDEAHYVKGRANYWTWAVQELASRADFVIPMTGTPIPNWSHELYTILQLLHPEENKRGGKYGSFWRWAETWFDTTPTRFSQGNPVVGALLGCTKSCELHPAENPCTHYQAFAANNLGNRWMRHLRDECLDLPPLTFETIRTRMDNATLTEYRNMRRDFVAVIEGNETLAWSQGAKNVALDRITTSPWLLNPTGAPAGGKFDQLRSDLQGMVASGEQVLVLAHYRDTVEACAQIALEYGPAGYVHGGLTAASVEREVEQFKKGKSRVLVGSLETLAEGVTLTMANTAIFVERSYKPSRNEQATYRIHRMGQDRACTVKRYITPNSVDSKKEKLLEAKTDHQMRMLTAAELSKLL